MTCITKLTLLNKITRRFIIQKARGHPFLATKGGGHRAPTACKLAISGTISLPLQGFFSTFPHGTCALSVLDEYLALASGLADFLWSSTCSIVIGYLAQKVLSILPTGLSPSLAAIPIAFDCRISFVTFRRIRISSGKNPVNP